MEVTVKLLMDAIEASGGQRFLVDGFPRNANNLAGWHRVVGDSLDVAGVLLYDCPEEVMEARLLERGPRRAVTARAPRAAPPGPRPAHPVGPCLASGGRPPLLCSTVAGQPACSRPG